MSIDFPRAWQIARASNMEEHHEQCSYRQTEGVVLCDCDVIHEHPEYLDDILQTENGVPYGRVVRKGASHGMVY
jgi:hypothetical protein